MKRIFLLLVTLLFSCEYSHARPTITVSAAISLKESLTQIGARWTKQSGVDVRFNFAGSGTLQQQIERGAPVDVFISAADKQMNALAAKNFIDKSTRRVIASNQLVIVTAKNSPLRLVQFQDLVRARRIAIGAPKSVPAGQYAQQTLQKLGLWNRLLPKTVQTKDVREVLTQVELGNVDAGFVYRTDALWSPRIRIAKTVPQNFHQPIRYPASVVSSTRNTSGARAFVRFLASPTAQRILRARGFLPARL